MIATIARLISSVCCILILLQAVSGAQIPMERVLSRVKVASEGDLRGLVDLTGFPQTAEQMDFIGETCEELEKDAILENRQKYGLSEDTAFTLGICPHDDYMIAARVYAHVQRYMKAKTIILIGNAHWGEAFGIRNKIVFGNFKRWRGPYGAVSVSKIRERIISELPADSYTVNRKLAETEHSLEGIIPFLQYYNRNVEIVPIFVPYSDWKSLDRIGAELAKVVSGICRDNGWELGRDLAVLISTDGQHYGDYGWSYYDYHPHGCTAEGYAKAAALDKRLVNTYLTGGMNSDKVHGLFAELVDERDISNYKVTWCGRFAAPFGVNFAVHLAKDAENRTLNGSFLRHGSSLSDPWLPLRAYGLGLTSDTNFHNFVTYIAVGYK